MNNPHENIETYLQAKGYSEREAAQGAHEAQRRIDALGKGDARNVGVKSFSLFQKVACALFHRKQHHQYWFEFSKTFWRCAKCQRHFAKKRS